MRKRGFSLLELMITLGVLTIVATVAVPKVQVWNARNRGLKTVMELVSDFSKAKSVAGYTVAVDTDNGKIEIPVNIDDDGSGSDKMPVYMGIRRQTAIMLRRTEYAIYQKDSMTETWDGDATVRLLKKNVLMNTVTIEKVNGNPTPESTTSFSNSGRFSFTSTGKLKYGSSGALVPAGQGGEGKCGDSDRYLPNVIFSAIIRSKISKSGNDSIWYRLDIDQRGEYLICSVFTDTDSVDYGYFSGNGSMLLDI